MKNKITAALTTCLLLSATALITGLSSSKPDNPAYTGAGNRNTLEASYTRWRQQQGSNIHQLTLKLAYTKALSSEFTDAKGHITVDLTSGNVHVQVSNLPTQQSYRVYLLDKTSEAIELGSLTTNSHSSELKTHINRSQFKDFEIDQAIIMANNTQPPQPGLLYGTPSFFQRLHYSRQLWPIARLNNVNAGVPEHKSDTPFSFLLPKLAQAGTTQLSTASNDLAAVLEQQIARGRDLFFNEAFEGNGRTCGTCHREDNNHTLDPLFIARLPDDDPLFVHEQNPELAELEDPQLLRQLGLVKANLDGFDRPGVFRAISHTLSLSLSMTPEEPEKDPDVQGFTHMLGWSGDGSPDDGSLRMFTQGAIIQHMPKTLNRVAGIDFRLATTEELDALEAYMLSLGRTEEFDLEHMTFTNPIVEQGKVLFHSKDPKDIETTGTGECKGCHFNGGGNSSSSKANGIRDTGVENLPNQLTHMLNPKAPVDGGFGQTIRHDCGHDHSQTCYGNKKFNMITAFQVDTAPFFHNNSATTIEEAVAFYNSDAFNQADDRGIHMEPSVVVAISLFLRTLGAIDNIRSSNQLDEKASRLTWRLGRKNISLAIAETEDAIQLLEQGALNVNSKAIDHLKHALWLQGKARKSRSEAHRSPYLEKAIYHKLEAQDAMVLM